MVFVGCPGKEREGGLQEDLEEGAEDSQRYL